MKKALFILSCAVIVIVCLSVAIVTYNDHKVAKQKAEVSELAQAQATLKQHDAVNAKAVSNANGQIILLTSQKNTLCTQIKTAKLVQPLCP